ncbi:MULTISPECIES: ATP-binding protein [unclassified Streptomyces]|uniref:ATP-binding protein n=1 Tax=unclassified Streptomyces TaxID=2593676 RepID=UPI000DBA9D6C|nr:MULTISPECIES: ATP-binding protein [unclassified Streptomyces]MYT68169.1 ATP-binding protein [Streptomyces sp. SID8367]RAJ72737.1 anti-sigma regulatory factor (Ser/Thr protein kinase) [Streptomyces sp. PsTaAH-137]
MFTTNSTRASITQARRQVTEHLTASGVPADLEAVQLVVSELVTNAVRHTPDGSWTLNVTVDGDQLTIDVCDSDMTPPHRRAGDLEDGRGGLGLPLIESLCDNTETTITATGKTVTALWKIA